MQAIEAIFVLQAVDVTFALDSADELLSDMTVFRAKIRGELAHALRVPTSRVAVGVSPNI